MTIIVLFSLVLFVATGILVISPANGQTVTAIIKVGNTPVGIGVNPSINKVYVANQNDDTVSVIDGSNDKVLTTINVGDMPVYIGANTQSSMVYVGNSNDDTVSVIDGSNDNVVDTIKGIAKPYGIGVNPTTDKIYVSSAIGPFTSPGKVFVIDGSTNSVKGTTTVGIGPNGIGVNPTTNKVYVSNGLSATVSVIDGSADTVVSTITLPWDPTKGQPGNDRVSVNPTTNKVYITNSLYNSVTVIDGSNDKIVDTITGLHGPRGIDLNSNTNKLYVNNHPFDSVAVIDAANKQILSSVTVENNPFGIGVNSNTNKIYVSSTGGTSNHVFVISEQPNNNPPTCIHAQPSVSMLWPPNHIMKNIKIQSVTDPDNDPITIQISSIYQDEPTQGLGTGDQSPDGTGLGTDTANVRAERSANGDGRVYHIGFTANDGKGAVCNGEVTLSVPHDQAHTAIDSGKIYDSTM